MCGIFDKRYIPKSCLESKFLYFKSYDPYVYDWIAFVCYLKNLSDPSLNLSYFCGSEFLQTLSS